MNLPSLSKIGLPQYWPSGARNDEAQQRLVLEWAKQKGLSYSTRGLCMRWLARGQCGVDFCFAGCLNRPSWMDHTSGWTRDGKPVLLLAQPYHLHPHDFASMATFEEQFGVDINVNGKGWYGHGTVAVWVTRKGARGIL